MPIWGIEALSDALQRNQRVRQFRTRQQQELFVTEAAHRLSGTQMALDVLAEVAQHRITSGVTVGIVDLLEVVQIQQRKAHRL